MCSLRVGRPPHSVSAGKAVNDGSWHDVMLTHVWSNGTLTLWVDGVQVSRHAERLVRTRDNIVVNVVINSIFVI